MVYDPKTNTITLGADSEFLADSGVSWVHRIRKMAQAPNTPARIKDDWRILERWLGCTARDLTNDDDQKIARAWTKYYAIGVAPSKKLQGTFDFMREKYKNDAVVRSTERPPSEVMDVFDRLSATDKEIKEKQAEDMEAERKRFAAVLGNERRGFGGWWRSRSRLFRLWVFGSVVWGALVLLVAAIFDPFDREYADEPQVWAKIIFILALPLVGGALKYAYDRLVK